MGMGGGGGQSGQSQVDVNLNSQAQQDALDEKNRQARLALASQGSGTNAPAWMGGFGGGGQAQQGTPSDASIGYAAAGGAADTTATNAPKGGVWNSSQWNTGMQGKAAGDEGGAFPQQAPAKNAYPAYGKGYSANWWDK